MFKFEKTGTGSLQCSCTSVCSEVYDEYGSYDSTTAKHDGNFNNKFEKDGESEDFAFDLNEQLDIQSRTADELFDGGKIKLLEQPPKIHKHSNVMCVEINRRDDTLLEGNDGRQGRERVYYSSSSRRQKLSRSLSPIRAPTMVSEPDHKEKCCSKLILSLSSSSNSASWYGRWKLTDMLLFRNSSDGYAINRKYDKLKKVRSQNEDEIKNSSFRSTDTACVSMSNKKKKVHADEWQHYKVYQGTLQEMRRKTFLPYKKSIISCMDMDGGAF
ncbi:uncharacterized protein LOC141721065 [Apium graveolens]|uniref:uncharacterized protein LOC141721065 n=1 Tax=Apium graveolens TaxID=4045 RepID=UPI003D7BEE17